jgi:hypothetical protein
MRFQMTKLLWVLGAALVALVVTRVALQSRAGRKSPMHALARDYLAEQLAAKGIADKVPSRCVTEIAQRYADTVESRPLRRLAAASELMKRIDTGVVFIAEWVREGQEFPRSIGDLPLPALGVPDALQEDALDSDN